MDLQRILEKLFVNAHAVGIEGVFQFDFGQGLAYWSEVCDNPCTGVAGMRLRTSRSKWLKMTSSASWRALST